MIIDRIKGFLSSKSINLDMFSNADFDDCKSKYNSLVYLLYFFLDADKKDSSKKNINDILNYYFYIKILYHFYEQMNF